MKVHAHIFRGYDLRGIVGEDLNEELAQHLGKAHGTMLKKTGITEAVVGRDCRATGPAYSAAVVEGLRSVGINVVDIGMTMVGTFYWAQYFLKSPGGVFVTASHNPPEYNGFKFANNYSETYVSAGMQELRRRVEAEDYEPSERLGTLVAKDIRADYYADLIGRFNITKKF